MGKLRNHNRAHKVCEICEGAFTVPHYRRDRARFCSKSCRSAAIAREHLNKGRKPWAARNLDGHRHKSSSRFQEGHKPWNAGMKGLHLSPETEWKPGRESDRRLPFGTVTIRTDKAGKPRAWVKTPDGWVPRAQAAYIAKYGAIPNGRVLHHSDGDTLNDRPSNLVPVTRPEHIAEHREDLLGAKDG